MTAAFCFLLAFQITPQVTQHINAGMKAKSAGDLETAAREFQRVVQLAPDVAAAHVNLGAVYLAMKNYSAAIPALRRSIELSSNLPGAHGMLGTALLAQGFACEAVPHLEKGEINDLLGVALLDCNRPREALERLESALEKRSKDPDLLYYVGKAHSELARRAFENVLAIPSDSPRKEQVLGEALAAAGNRTAAEQHFRAALAARSDIPGVHFAIGELLLQSGDYENAEAEFRAETQLAPGSAAAAYKLGCALANRGRNAEAIAELKRANAIQPGMPETLFELGKVLNASGDAKAAEGYLREVLAAEQDSSLSESAHFQLAQVYRKLGRSEDAAREMKAFEQLRTRRGGK